MSEEQIFKSIQQFKTATLSEQVADKISELIKERGIQKGERLPNEFELAESLNVGRGTVREAVKLLVARNCLEIRRGKGTFVVEDTGKVADPLGFEYITDLSGKIKLAENLYEIRAEIEPWVARLAAQRITEEEKPELIARCDKVDAMIDAGLDHNEADIAFHQYIAQCTHNEVLTEIIPIISYSVQLFTRFRQEDLLDKAKKSHRRTAEAICAEDPDAAAAAMRYHIDANLDSIALMRELEANKQN